MEESLSSSAEAILPGVMGLDGSFSYCSRESSVELGEISGSISNDIFQWLILMSGIFKTSNTICQVGLLCSGVKTKAHLFRHDP